MRSSLPPSTNDRLIYQEECYRQPEQLEQRDTKWKNNLMMQKPTFQ